MTCRGVFDPLGAACELDGPCLLSEAAVRAGVFLNVACGGKGSCGGCAVDLLAGRFATAGGDEIALPAGGQRVLACQTRWLGGDFRIRVPRHSLVEAGEKIVMDFAHTSDFALRPPVRKERLTLQPPRLHDQRGDLCRITDELRRRGYDAGVLCSVYVARLADVVARANYDITVTVAGQRGAWHVIRIEPGDTTRHLYGAAVDIGTTSVVVALVDLVTGKLVDSASSYNQQVMRCDDVASRISYASTPQRLEELRHLVVEGTINRLLDILVRRHKVASQDVAHMSVSGNTVMTHLFCGVSPASLGGVPFAPISNYLGPYRAGQLHVAMNPEGFVDVAPSTAAYIGGDITSDMFACGLQTRKETTALIDIGTNAEIVVGNRDRAIACAAPAGPAFEGRGISCGMRASIGAIDSLALDSLEAAPKLTVIGGGKPAGVCGSGLIDFLAVAYKAGVISSAGRFTGEALERCPRIRRVDGQNGAQMLAYEIVPAADTDDGLSPVLLTERDIASLLQAKGVIYAALQIAMKHFGKSFGEIDRFVLAGGFAKHINLDNAVAMGMLPDIPRERFLFIGNGSLAGAFLALSDANVRDKLPHVAAMPATIELNLDPDFMDAYTMAMFLP